MAQHTLSPSRRRFIARSALVSGALALNSTLPAWARSGRANTSTGISELPGSKFNLNIARATSSIDGKQGASILVNGHLPAPLLRWREGDHITLNVTNHLDVDTSIHWHGILLPFQMDGVPGVTFPGIKPGETFTYNFPLLQAGTYWYHSHSGLQEQSGHYGPIVIEPKAADPVAYEREYVMLLSDWTFEDPHAVFATLKKMSDSYNRHQRTVGDFVSDAGDDGLGSALSERLMWGAMRMNPTDLADVTGATYTYLINGHGPQDNWTGLFAPGERVRIRFINASAMSIFNVRIPGLAMQIVQADGLDVKPVETDEFQIGVAETFDVVVKPEGDRAYTVMAESNDRSGYARATLTPRLGLTAAVPPLRERPTLSMKDMAMDHGAMGHGSMKPEVSARQPKQQDGTRNDGINHSAMGQPTIDPASMDHGAMDHSSMDHASMDHSSKAKPIMSHAEMGHSRAKPGTPQAHHHRKGPGVVGLAMHPINRLGERPLGLEHEQHRVLVYTDLESLEPNPDTRSPERELELHLTSNMERYMWSFDGVKFSEVDGPIIFYKNERLRLTLVNDTMMPHPIHLHGMFFDVVTAAHDYKPRKHTIVVKPGEKMSVDITADAVGDWAFHCHLLYHMHAGMMRVVSVVDEPRPA